MKRILKVFYIIKQMLQDAMKLWVKSFYSYPIAQMSRYVIHEAAYFFILNIKKKLLYS